MATMIVTTCPSPYKSRLVKGSPDEPKVADHIWAGCSAYLIVSNLIALRRRHPNTSTCMKDHSYPALCLHGSLFIVVMYVSFAKGNTGFAHTWPSTCRVLITVALIFNGFVYVGHYSKWPTRYNGIWRVTTEGFVYTSIVANPQPDESLEQYTDTVDAMGMGALLVWTLSACHVSCLGTNSQIPLM